MLEVITVIFAALAASFLAAIAGFGGSVIMLPVLVWTTGITDAIPILTIAQLIGNLSRVIFFRHELNWSVIRRFSLGAVPAAVLGGVIFATVPASALVRVLGIFLVIMVAYRHTRLGRNIQLSLRGFAPLGAAAGLISAVIGTAGPLVAPFFLAYGLLKGAYIGTEAMTAVVMHVTKIVVYGSYALIGIQTLLIGLSIGAIMIFGTFLGRKALYKVPEHVFPYIIEATLLVSGVIFLLRG